MKSILRALAVLCLVLFVSCGCEYQLVSDDQMQAKIDEAVAAATQEAYSQGLADGLGQTEEESAQEDTEEVTVYVTTYGSKYHESGCQYLEYSCIPKTLSEAQRAGYGPCSACQPPQ
jgi:hypothetical protein